MGLNCFFCVVYLRGLWEATQMSLIAFSSTSTSSASPRPQRRLWVQDVNFACFFPDGSTRRRRGGVWVRQSSRASDTKTLGKNSA